MDDKFKPQKKLIAFERHNKPLERRYCFDGREITLSVYAEGKRTFESQYAIDRRFCDDGPYPAPDPTLYYAPWCASSTMRREGSSRAAL